MMQYPSKVFLAAAALTTFVVSAAMAETTPYDLIRPIWPMKWDTTAMDLFDTTVTTKVGVLPTEKTPENYKAGELIPDTVDQAYLDMINTKISPIRVNQAGYLESDQERQFYFVGSATEFEIVDIEGKSLSPKVTGAFTSSGSETSSNWTIIAGTNATNYNQERYSVKFTGPSGIVQIGHIPQTVPTEQRLRVKVGDELSSTFIVSDDVYTMVKDAALKFFGIQRSGNSESWFHGPSHVKDGSGMVVNNVTSSASTSVIRLKAGDLQGGWYDCGDHLKESFTQAFAFMSLAVMAATNPDKDVDHYAYNQAKFVNTDNVPDVLREAKYGADFFLRAYRVADGVIDNMPVSVGNFGSDHGWWGRPEVQDYVTTSGRGGASERDVRLGEIGSNIGGETAAGLAILGKLYAQYDKDFADSCLMVAKKMYDFAKALATGQSSYDGGKTFEHNKDAAGWSSPAYNGNNEYFDDMALAAVALWYATEDTTYANDAIRSQTLGTTVTQRFEDCAGCFTGGWFATDSWGFLKNVKNTSWANSYSYALYALYKLILSDKTKAMDVYGLTEEEWLNAIEDCIMDMAYNLGDMGSGTATISLPSSLSNGISFKQTDIKYDPAWYSMQTDQTWIYNRYQVGNIFEVLAYADVARDIAGKGIVLPDLEASDWMADEMYQLGINQLNYMLGVNPWDISFVYGVGDKNDNHPHHRASNPEGRNYPFFNYKYVRPVGGLMGAVAPDGENSWVPSTMSWFDYHQSEVCLDGSAMLLSALTMVSNGGDDYYEKSCPSCDTTEHSLFVDSVYATAYHYESDGKDFISLSLYNSTLNGLDSIVAYIYYKATEGNAGSCGIDLDTAICKAYDLVASDNVCSVGDSLLRENLGNPQKVEGTFNVRDSTYTWAMPIFLNTISFGQSIRLDIGISSGSNSVKITDGWSFTSHTTSDSLPDYAGTPTWDKDQGDIQEAPMDPYIVIRSQGKLLWGYGPANETADRIGIHAIARPTTNTRMVVEGRSLLVQARAQGTKTLKIFDVLGNQLMVRTFNGTSAQISLGRLPHRGTMIAKLLSGNTVLDSKAFRLK